MLSTGSTVNDPVMAVTAVSSACALDAACEIVHGVMLYYSRFDSKVEQLFKPIA